MTQGLELRGAVLGKGYRLGRRIDDADETLYEGTHERIPGHFVIRMFPTESLSQPESSSRIQRGSRVASLLRDPHAIQVLDFNASGEMPAFVVMERQLGPSLASVMADTGMLPLSRVVDVVDSIAAALTAGHRIGLVHGDLRPAHVVLPAEGTPATKLSGFGWAKELRAAARVPAPSGYLAPEQKFGKVLTLDERVDQFGLAALAYEMIAACQPFSEESADMADVLGLGAPRVPPAIADLVPGIPSALDEVLRRALS
ncbi:MAG: protein kinase, partial [Pseudomonadota bacterium]